MKSLIQFSVLSLAFAVTACGGKTVAPTAPKSSSSWFGGPKTVSVRAYRQIELENGMKIFFVRDESLPRISLQALVKVGDVNETGEMSGLNSMVASMLDQGTKTRSAPQLSEEFNNLGTEFAASAATEGTTLSANSLSPDASKLLELFADVLMNPSFTAKEVARLKSQYLSAIKKQVDNASGYASEEFDSYLFGEHPYGRRSMGTLQSIGRIQRTDMIRHYFAYYRPNNTVLAVAGRFDDQFENEIKTVFSKWAKRDLQVKALEAPARGEAVNLRLVSKGDLQQTQIRIGRVGISRGDADYLPLFAANVAFGGGFSSRLMQKIRDDLGLTYSISSSESALRTTGVFQISTFTKNTSVGKTLEEILKVYKEFAANGITEAELASAKAQFQGQYPRSIETADQVASRILSLTLNDRPLSELAEMPGMVDRLSLKQVNEAIRKHYGAPGLKILVFGDKKAVGEQLKPWNPEIISL